MEDDNPDFSASFSWWSDSHNRPLQSSWLQATLSDLDDKIQMMVNLIQYDGDSFVERADRFYKRRPELLKIVQELYNSYLSLAEKYDQLRSAEFIPPAHLMSLSSPSTLQLLHDTETTKLEESAISQPQSVQQDDCDPETQPTSFERYSSNGPVSYKQWKMEEDNDGNNMNRGGGIEKIIGGGDSEEKDKRWNQMREKVSKLMEENVKQQNELIRRNEEKREMIKQLGGQMMRLMEENKALKSCLAGYTMDMNPTESRASKLKGLNCIGSFQT